MTTKKKTVQQRMMDLLSDGNPHTSKELHGCLEDELGPVSNIDPHLDAIRKKIRPTGQDLICQRHNGVSWYTLLNTPGIGAFAEQYRG